MIKQISKKHIGECAQVIKNSFITVAKEFNITEENAPRYVAFATTKEKLTEQFESGRLMYAYFKGNKIIGFYSLNIFDNTCEISNLCVLSEYRHLGIGKELLEHALSNAKELHCKSINISIVEENRELKKWYEKYGFVATHTEKYDFFPFTCGYMKKELKEGLI
ncbi:MAG: GNAT family N-acetyltransferase [Eubacterium sp.]